MSEIEWHTPPSNKLFQGECQNRAFSDFRNNYEYFYSSLDGMLVQERVNVTPEALWEKVSCTNTQLNDHRQD